jgi:hypothetical protein
MSLGAQNMKTRSDDLGTAENESGSAKHENGTGRPQYHRKWVWELKTGKGDPTPSLPSKMSSGTQNMKTLHDALSTAKISPGVQNMKTGPDAVGTAENWSGSAKHENGTRHRRYRGKRVQERTT